MPRPAARGPPAGAWTTACRRKRLSTPSRPRTSTPPPAWWKNSGCRPTGKDEFTTHPQVVPVAGGSGRDGGTPDGRRAGRALFRVDGAQPVEAERWAEVVERWQYGDATQRGAPYAEAYAAILRAPHVQTWDQADARGTPTRLCAGAAESIVTPAPALYQGLARVLSGDLGWRWRRILPGCRWPRGASRSARDSCVVTLCERVARGDGTWQNGAGPRSWPIKHAPCCARPGSTRAYATPLGLRGAQARAALHRGDVPAARTELVSAQRLRHLLTYAMPQLAVQARIELAHVHLALGDLAGARTLRREIDELLRQRPDLGTLIGEAQCAPDPGLSSERDPSAPGASALTAAELRLLPLLCTHLSFPEIAAEMFSLAEHGQIAGVLALSQAGRLPTQPGGRPIPGPGPPGRGDDLWSGWAACAPRVGPARWPGAARLEPQRLGR